MTTALTRPAAAAAARRRGRHELPPGRPLRRWEALAYLLLGAALAAAVLLPGRGEPSVDTSPRLYFQPARTLTGAFSTWNPAPTLGQQSYDAGIAPVAAAVWAVRALARSVWLTARLWRLLLLLLLLLLFLLFLLILLLLLLPHKWPPEKVKPLLIHSLHIFKMLFV